MMTMTMKMNSIEISCRSDSRIVSLLLFFGIFFIKSKWNSRTALTQAKIMNKKRKNKREKRHTSINSLQWWILLWTINSEYIFDVLFANHLNFEHKPFSISFSFIEKKKRTIFIYHANQLMEYLRIIQYHGLDLGSYYEIESSRHNMWYVIINEMRWNGTGWAHQITSHRNVLDLSNTKIIFFVVLFLSA